jgi:aspartate/methionine/tyrosine aminotransferase
VKISQRAQQIEPFHVMEVAKAANALAAQYAQSDAPMIFLNIGEPDFTAPPLVQEAALRAIRDGATQYTAATGLPLLKERISHWYRQRFGLFVAPERIVITSGASAALQLVCLALIDAGDEVLMASPGYPCNRHFVAAAGGTVTLLQGAAQDRFQPTAAQVAAAWQPGKTQAVLLASPANPTGASIAPDELQRMHQTVRQHGGTTVVDEIYLGLSFDAAYGQTALALGEDIISVNSFSKYFNMTGWRLGWLVLPSSLVPVVERLAQNLFICPSAIAQHAALACFEDASIAEYERRRWVFKARRDFFVPALKQLGLAVPVLPDGAFYAWADCALVCARLGLPDSAALGRAMMQSAHVAVTPGRDFDAARGHHFIRFSTANASAELEHTIARLKKWLA